MGSKRNATRKDKKKRRRTKYNFIRNLDSFQVYRCGALDITIGIRKFARSMH